MQYNLKVPKVLLQLSQTYEPSFLGDINFRLLNLRAEIKKETSDNKRLIYQTAMQIDQELETWRATLAPDMTYGVVHNISNTTYFKGTRHTYKDLWAVQLWNSWRTMSIQVNQIILQNDIYNGGLITKNLAESKVRDSCTDICISVPEIIHSPRKYLLLCHCSTHLS